MNKLIPLILSIFVAINLNAKNKKNTEQCLKKKEACMLSVSPTCQQCFSLKNEHTARQCAISTTCWKSLGPSSKERLAKLEQCRTNCKS